MVSNTQHAADAGRPTAGAAPRTRIEVAKADSRAGELYAQAQAACRQSRALGVRLRAAQDTTAETMRLIHGALERSEEIRQLWAGSSADRLRYSSFARLQARLASMPVIEQAKGIIMAQSGWSEEKAFDALRRASQRQNIRVRELAARVVASAALPGAAQQHRPPARPGPQPPSRTPASGGRRRYQA